MLRQGTRTREPLAALLNLFMSVTRVEQGVKVVKQTKPAVPVPTSMKIDTVKSLTVPIVKTSFQAQLDECDRALELCRVNRERLELYYGKEFDYTGIWRKPSEYFEAYAKEHGGDGLGWLLP